MHTNTIKAHAYTVSNKPDLCRKESIIHLLSAKNGNKAKERYKKIPSFSICKGNTYEKI